MKKILIGMLTLGSISSFAQSFPLHYGKLFTLAVSTKKTVQIDQRKIERQENRVQGRQRIVERLYDYPFVDGTTKVQVINKKVCVAGVVEMGNKLTPEMANYKVANSKCLSLEGQNVLSLNINPETLFGVTMVRGQIVMDPISERKLRLYNNPNGNDGKIETGRCIKTKKLERLSKKMGCYTNKFSINGHSIKLENL